LLAACSTTVDDAPVCLGADEECVEQTRVIDLMAQELPGFTARGLLVEWHDEDADVLPWMDGTQAGVTWDVDHIEVRSRGALVHELLHAHLWRCVGDPDRGHTDATAQAFEDRIKAAL
jgi:hypothetical protein